MKPVGNKKVGEGTSFQPDPLPDPLYLADGRRSHTLREGRVQVWLDQKERRVWMANTGLKCLNLYRCEVFTYETVTPGMFVTSGEK